jgi:hypothetical protein
MNAPSRNMLAGQSRKRPLFVGLILVLMLAAYSGWQSMHRYQVESEVLGAYKGGNRALVIVLVKELENDPQHWGVADLISKTLADRLRQRGYSIQLVTSESAAGRRRREQAETAGASGHEAYESGHPPLASEVAAAQAGVGVLRVYLDRVEYMTRSKTVVGETYALELSNPDRSPAWKATLTYRNTLLEPVFSLIQYSAGNPAAGRWEALTDEAVERMRQQGVLK